MRHFQFLAQIIFKAKLLNFKEMQKLIVPLFLVILALAATSPADNNAKKNQQQNRTGGGASRSQQTPGKLEIYEQDDEAQMSNKLQECQKLLQKSGLSLDDIQNKNGDNSAEDKKSGGKMNEDSNSSESRKNNRKY